MYYKRNMYFCRICLSLGICGDFLCEGSKSLLNILVCSVDELNEAAILAAEEAAEAVNSSGTTMQLYAFFSGAKIISFTDALSVEIKL